MGGHEDITAHCQEDNHHCHDPHVTPLQSFSCGLLWQLTRRMHSIVRRSPVMVIHSTSHYSGTDHCSVSCANSLWSEGHHQQPNNTASFLHMSRHTPVKVKYNKQCFKYLNNKQCYKRLQFSNKSTVQSV